MTVYGAVFARAGSKAVPGKNLRIVGGVSLLGRAISLGVRTPSIDEMLCSTDAREIADVAESFGAAVPFLRPSALSGDHAPEWDAWKHLADHLFSVGATESDLLVSIPATSPLRVQEDIENAIHFFQASKFDLVLAVSETSRNPWFNMVTRREDGTVELAIVPGGELFSRRQDAPEVFDITTAVYVTSLGFVQSSPGIFGGLVGSIVIPPERALDVDTELDIEIADLMLRRKKDRG